MRLPREEGAHAGGPEPSSPKRKTCKQLAPKRLPREEGAHAGVPEAREPAQGSGIGEGLGSAAAQRGLADAAHLPGDRAPGAQPAGKNAQPQNQQTLAPARATHNPFAAVEDHEFGKRIA